MNSFVVVEMGFSMKILKLLVKMFYNVESNAIRIYFRYVVDEMVFISI